jgi:DNA polymerase-1
MSDFPNVRGPLTIAVDLETIDPNLKDRGPGAMRRDGHVIGIALGLPGEAGRYYPLDGPEEELVDHPYPEVTIRYFRDLLLRPDITVVGANLLYDLLWLRTLGVEVQGPLEDVQLAEQLINENLPTYSLESLSQRYLGRGKLGGELEAYAAERGWKSHWPHLAEMPISLVGRYAAVDAANTLAVREIQQNVLLKENLNGIYDLECELIRVVLDMTWRGIRIDEDKCHRVLDHCRWERDKNVQEMERIAGGGWEADIWSVPTISEAATRLGYPIGVSEKDGDSFDKEFLNKHRGEIPFYECLLQARQFDRCGEVYVKDKILDMAYNGRIYPTWRQGRGDRYVSGGLGDGIKGTRSGRFSSEAPNLQQLPARHGELASMVRGCLSPEEGERWMSSDFASQEPRLTVHYGTLIKDKSAELVAAAYRADPNTDYHQKVRDMIEDVAGVNITRKHAKTINLGMAYGMGKGKLAGELGMNPDEAEPIIQAYHSSVPYIRKLQNMTTAKANKEGAIRTLLGRVRHFNQFWRVPYQQGDKPLPFDEAKRTWPNSRLERAGAYKALNALIQGSAADQTKRAMVLCHNAGLKMLATVHDELCFSVSSEAEIRKAIEIMENAVELAVPMKVDVEVGPSWGELEEFKQ